MKLETFKFKGVAACGMFLYAKTVGKNSIRRTRVYKK